MVKLLIQNRRAGDLFAMTTLTQTLKRRQAVVKYSLRYGVTKASTQRVVIYYRFVGYIDLSEANFVDAILQQENHKAETRQGVAVEYLSEKPKPEHRPAEEVSASA